MGAYWYVINLDKQEYLDAHQLGEGLKFDEQLHGSMVGRAVLLLCSVQPSQGKKANQILGSWAANRIVWIGEETRDEDLPEVPHASTLARKCTRKEDWEPDSELCPEEFFKDVTPQVAEELEQHLQGRFAGTGWRFFVTVDEVLETAGFTRQAPPELRQKVFEQIPQFFKESRQIDNLKTFTATCQQLLQAPRVA